MKEVLVAVYFDIEKAYDMMWREGVLLKLQRIGIVGRCYNWVLSFLFGRTIQVKVGSVLSQMANAENGTPQGIAISPILFNMMINDVFEGIHPGISTALYADDGAMWKRGKNVKYIVHKILEAMAGVEKWSVEWGCPKCVVSLKKKRITENIKLYLYKQPLERVTKFKYLGIWFD